MYTFITLLHQIDPDLHQASIPVFSLYHTFNLSFFQVIVYTPLEVKD